ncbi:ISAs1 family transposase [Salininema proteolyticum]|uniref:ISAs1 family transposase n=1 Tax=Salininema proteolyticum TaxID=1607685 RepID=UPI003638B667
MPDPRSRRGRWYPLASVLAIAAAAVSCGATTISEIAEWAEALSADVLHRLGFRFHPFRLRRSPSRACISTILTRIDAEALDQALCQWLIDRHQITLNQDKDQDDSDPTPRKRRPLAAKALDGKSLKGSKTRGNDRRHLLSLVTHDDGITYAQQEVGKKTNETTGFKPLLEPFDLTGTVLTFDALHTVKELLRWVHEEKNAYYVAIVKRNQELQYQELEALPWNTIPIGHTASGKEHGRKESRSVKITCVDESVEALRLPGTSIAIRLHRRRKPREKKENPRDRLCRHQPARPPGHPRTHQPLHERTLDD